MAEMAVNSSAVRSSKARPCSSSPSWSRIAISWSSGESIIVGEFGELGWVELAQVLSSTVQLLLHLESSRPQFGVGLGRTAEDQSLVAAGQALFVVAGVETKSDKGGAETSRLWAGLLHQDHRSGDLSRGGVQESLA